MGRTPSSAGLTDDALGREALRGDRAAAPAPVVTVAPILTITLPLPPVPVL